MLGGKDCRTHTPPHQWHTDSDHGTSSSPSPPQYWTGSLIKRKSSVRIIKPQLIRYNWPNHPHNTCINASFKSDNSAQINHLDIDLKPITKLIQMYLSHPIISVHQISIHLNQSFTCSRYQLWTNQTYLQECDRNTKKCLAASVRKSHRWWRFSAAFHTVRSFASHHKLSY